MDGWWSTGHTPSYSRRQTGSIGTCTSCSCSSSEKGGSMTAVASKPYTRPLTLEWRGDGSLWALRGDEECAVSVRRCFPWSEPMRHLSLRDSDEQEFALVKDPAELDPRSRAALEVALAVAGFVFEVTRVLEIEEEVEIRHWRGGEQEGPRTFQTRLGEWARAVPPRGGGVCRVAPGVVRLRPPGGLS